MSTLCEVCNAVPPKYKCPTCQVRYCSIVCFKPHKETHASQGALPSVASKPQPALAVQPPQPTYNIYNLKSNPAFNDLLARHPNLKPQLAEIWQMTLPPSAAPDMSAAYHSRGGRQGGKFKQERADEAAATALGRLTDDEAAANEGLREFVRLVASLSGGAHQGG